LRASPPKNLEGWEASRSRLSPLRPLLMVRKTLDLVHREAAEAEPVGHRRRGRAPFGRRWDPEPCQPAVHPVTSVGNLAHGAVRESKV